jgi:hypothetical protein
MPPGVKARIWLAGLTAICCGNCFVAAQTNQSAVASEDGDLLDRADDRDGEWRVGLTGDYASVAASGVNFYGAKGNSGAQTAEASLASETALNRDWFVPMDITLRNYSFGTLAHAPIPNQIYTLALNAGLGYHLDDQWTVGGALGPRFYRLDAVDGSGIGIGHSVWATYRWKPNLKVAFAIAVDPNRDVPVLPAGGLRWEIQTNVTLRLMFPRSGLDYRVDAKLTIRASFDGNYAVFRAEDDLGDKIGMTQFNNGLGTYRDFLLGAGAEYRVGDGFSASCKCGYSFDRELDYQRIGQRVKFDSAPFIQVKLKYRF